jgi:uncharacterized protein
MSATNIPQPIPQPGQFCWVELGTNDTSGAKAFYSGIFPWTPEDISMGEHGYYTLLKIGGKDAAALYKLQDEQLAQGIPPHWMLHVAVDDVDAFAPKAESAGGKVMMPPFDVMEHGRMAVVRDPQGGIFCAWQAKQHQGFTAEGDGTLCWGELAARETDVAERFYKEALGWETKKSQGPVEYTEWVAGGRPIGGMIRMTDEWGTAPSHWMPYFQVSDCDGLAQKAMELGGQVMVPPTDIPNTGRFAMLQDPQGAMFSVIYLKMG